MKALLTTAGAHAKRRDWIVVALIFSVSAVIAHEYFFRIDMPYVEAHLSSHQEFVQGIALSPYRYRILVPYLTEFLTRGFSRFLPLRRAFLLSYGLYDLSAIFFSLAVLFKYLRIWFSREQALVGVLFVAASMPLALNTFQPWSLLETGLWTTALVLMYRNRYWPLYLVTALATLNRETAFLIPLAFLFVGFDIADTPDQGALPRKRLIFLGTPLLIWLAVMVGLRLCLGNAPHVHTLGEILALNTSALSLFTAMVKTGLFLGFFWVFASLGFRYAPGFCKRVTLVVPFYVLTVVVWGVWAEVRLLMPLYPVVLPLGLSYIYRRWGNR